MTNPTNINPALERRVLASLFVDSEDLGNSEQASSVFATLTADDFTDNFCRKLFIVMKEVHDLGQVVTEEAILARLATLKEFSTVKGMSAYEEILDSIQGSRVMQILPSSKSLRELSNRRKFSLACKSVNASLNKGTPLKEALSENIAPLLETEDSFCDSRGKPMSAKAVFEPLVGIYTAAANGHEPRTVSVPTGVRPLDVALDGGFKSGQLVILGARPSVGKTTLALNFALNAIADGSKRLGTVLFVTLEMTSRDLAQKVLSFDAGTPVPKNGEQFRSLFKCGRVLGNFAELARRRMASPILFIEAVSDVYALCREARKAHKKSSLCAVFVDYLQLIPSSKYVSRRHEAVSEISMRLKSLAKELEVPVIALAQLNRNSADEDRSPRPSDLKESGQIEQDADIIILLSRDKTQTEEEAIVSGTRKVVVDLAKNRNGGIFAFPVAFHGASSRFEVWQ